MDASPPVSRSQIEHYVKASCNGNYEAINVSASLALFDLVRPRGYRAFDHQERVLPLGLKRTASIGLKLELLNADEVIFQFPFPRADRLDDHTVRVMLSVIHHAYAIGDYENAEVEMADLSCEEGNSVTRRERLPKVRSPRIVRLERKNIISTDDLAPEIQSVHDLLLELGDDPDPT